MSAAQGRRTLVLGGIRSGKSEYAEALLADSQPVRYVATARPVSADAEWSARIAAHRRRRPAGWRTTEVGDDPLALLDVLSDAEPHEHLLVDDLGTWVAAVAELPGGESSDAVADRIAAAVAASPARLVLVSPEVGLSVVPATEAGRRFADALGTVNRAVAAVCDGVVLVIAGNAVLVKGAP